MNVYIINFLLGKRHNLKPRFERKLNFQWYSVAENTHPGYLIDDISKFATDEEGDPLKYGIDAQGSEICTIGMSDGKLRLKITPDREVK